MKYDPNKQYEGAYTDPDGTVTDEEFHAEFLENEAANSASDRLAYETALAAGCSPAIASTHIYGENATPAADLSPTSEPQLGLGRSAVREHQIDFILQEEFLANANFLGQFLFLCDVADTEGAEVLDVLSSVRDETGETDVLVSYRLRTDAPATRRVLLIENKIDAAFGENQVARYKDRGELGMKSGKWTAYLSCLVAPQGYIHQEHGFDHAVALEDLLPVLAPEHPERQQAKQKILRTAIKEQQSHGLREEDLEVTRFRRNYTLSYNTFRDSLGGEYSSALAGVDAPPPRRAWRDDTWFEFRGPALGPKIYVNHKSQHRPFAVVDLTFRNTEAEALKERIGVEIDSDITVVQTGKSAAIRLQVPWIDCHKTCEEQQGSLYFAFSAVLRLVSFLTKHPELRT